MLTNNIILRHNPIRKMQTAALLVFTTDERPALRESRARNPNIGKYTKYRSVQHRHIRMGDPQESENLFRRAIQEEFNLTNILECRKNPNQTLTPYKEALCRLLEVCGMTRNEIGRVQRNESLDEVAISRLAYVNEAYDAFFEREREIETNEAFIFLAAYAILVGNKKVLNTALNQIQKDTDRGFKTILPLFRYTMKYDTVAEDHCMVQFSLVQFAIMAKFKEALLILAECYLKIATKYTQVPLTDIRTSIYHHDITFTTFIVRVYGDDHDHLYIEWEEALLEIDPQCIYKEPSYIRGKSNPVLLTDQYCRNIFLSEISTLWKIKSMAFVHDYYVPKIVSASFIYGDFWPEFIRNEMYTEYVNTLSENHISVFIIMVAKFHLACLLANKFGITQYMTFTHIVPMIFGTSIELQDLLAAERRILDLEKFDDTHQESLRELRYPPKYARIMEEHGAPVTKRLGDLICHYWPFMSKISLTKNKFNLFHRFT